jgi:2-octaprenyl-6-methoxyphenol hydroxylase
MNSKSRYDLVIVGGGMVGASLAIALADTGLRMALIEAFSPGDTGLPSYDDRGIALAHGTRRIFETLGLWSDLAPLVTPIEDIHISDRGHFGAARLSAAHERVPALGYVVTARELGGVLLSRLPSVPGLDLLMPGRLSRFEDDGDRVHLEVDRDGVVFDLDTRLLVAADGVDSTVREALGLPVVRWRYGHTAVVTNVTPARPHRNVAYERFTDTGPLALLPMSENRCAVVWTVRDDEVDATLGLDDAAVLDALQRRFGYRLGAFQRVGRRSAYPLQLMRARESVRGRVAVIGNAAHTLHPIAGQGFNLGIRDVAALADVIADALPDRDIGRPETLAAYQRWRSGEQHLVALATDGLARLFSNPLGILRLGRNLGLTAMELVPGLKHPLARAAMGMGGRQPRLARGVRLG